MLQFTCIPPVCTPVDAAFLMENHNARNCQNYRIATRSCAEKSSHVQKKRLFSRLRSAVLFVRQ